MNESQNFLMTMDLWEKGKKIHTHIHTHTGDTIYTVHFFFFFLMLCFYLFKDFPGKGISYNLLWLF